MSESVNIPDVQPFEAENNAAKVEKRPLSKGEKWYFYGLVPATAALAIAEYALRPDFEQIEPVQPDYSCDSFEEGLFEPPQEDALGFENTVANLETPIPTDGLAVSDTNVELDGSPILEGSLGGVQNDGSELAGTIDVPQDYAEAFAAVLQEPEIRWGVCDLDDGLNISATTSEALRNGHYDSVNDSMEIAFLAGDTEGKDQYFENARDLAYTLRHEGGHQIREEILGSSDGQSQEIVEQMDAVYKDHLTAAVDEYRAEHGDQIASDLDAILGEFQEVDEIGDGYIGKFAEAVQHVKTQLDQEGGLTQLAIEVSEDPQNPGREQIQLLDLEGMIANASEQIAGDDSIYGISEAVYATYEQTGDPAIYDIKNNTEQLMSEFLAERFASEKIMPGRKGGHSWDSQHEAFASAWSLTGLVSADNYGKILQEVPAEYRPYVEQQLALAAELRTQLNPNNL